MKTLDVLHRIAAIIFYVVGTVIMVLLLTVAYRWADQQDQIDPNPAVDCTYVRAPECSPGG